MSSTDLITYLNYMSTWESESDEHIDPLISEQNQFVNLGDFDSDSAVDSEFDTIHSLACEVRDRTIAADATQIAADAAAVASIWSFGMGMAAYAALEAAEFIEQKVISSKSADLNNKLTSADTDIAARIGERVQSYITIYKSNNNLIASKAPQGLDTRTCRANLLQFIAQVQRNTTLDAANFRKYAGSARKLFNSDEINKVYDALDTLNLSGRTDADLAKFMNVLAGLSYPKLELALVRNVCIAIMFNRLGVARTTIETQARDAGIPLEEFEGSAFGTMSAAGKFVTAVAVIMSVVDVIFQVLDIVDVVKQCNKMCDELDGTVRESYKSYFTGIKTAAAQYKAAIAGGPSAGGGPIPSQTQSLAMDVLVHLENIGDRHCTTDEFAGTRGESRRLEGFQISLVPPVSGLSMRYMAHLQNIGDTPFVNEGQFVGTRGQSRRLEGFAIELTGANAGQYDVSYMAHLQNIGDTPFARNGEFCGTRGQSRRVEGIQVRITRKNPE